MCKRPRSFAALATQEQIAELVQREQVSVSLKGMVDTGTGKFLPPDAKSEDVMLQISSFLNKEIPVRMAHRIRDLDTLPCGLCDMESVKTMKTWYLTSLGEMLEDQTPPKTPADEKKFKKKMTKIYQRHNDVLITTARALYEFKKGGQMEAEIQKLHGNRQQRSSGKYKQMTGYGGGDQPGIGEELGDLPQLHEALDQFLSHRLGIRVLIGQYLALHPEPTAKLLQFRHLQSTMAHGLNSFTEPTSMNLEDGLADVGLVCMRTLPAEIAAAAAADATDIFERQVVDLMPPEVHIIGNVDCTMSFIPSHLYYILFELIKNSMRATAEFHRVLQLLLLQLLLFFDPLTSVWNLSVSFRLLSASFSLQGTPLEDDLPPVNVIIGTSDESEDVAIKVGARAAPVYSR
jgi:pyruvate dehydrogenase kinase 2/3/4